MKRILETALAETAEQWRPLQTAFRWVHAAAHVLANPERDPVTTVKRRFGRVLETIGLVKGRLGALGDGLSHFLKVTRSYRPGLFHCYTIVDLPRTNNALEQLFGQHRHHERRATGRKRAPLSLVLRGSARLIVGVATRQRPSTANDLVLHDRERWRQLRASIRQRFALRAQGYRFRRDPQAYLARLEELALKQGLPA
ncbi:MAG: hypothetical protein HGA45_01375 [Chloroflexales bacterium]|nr:hypothetical protein [Chloroflexales bacterium]